MPVQFWGRRRLRARFWPTVAAALLFSLMLLAGNWQLGRAQQKLQRQAALQANLLQPPVDLGRVAPNENLLYRRVEASGSWLPQHAILIDNKVYHGVVGYQLLMPFRIAASGRIVLVKRGWLARSRYVAGLVQEFAGGEQLRGVAVIPPQRYLELSPDTVSGSVWQNLSLPRYRQQTGLDVAPIVIEESSAAVDGLVRDWPAPDAGVDKHHAYAFQWFCMAACVAGLYVFYTVQRRG